MIYNVAAVSLPDALLQTVSLAVEISPVDMKR